MNLSFIVIDNSDLDCYIAKKLIKRVFPKMQVKHFLAAAEALEHIGKDAGSVSENSTIIILDLLMPQMNGFEFIEAFELLPLAIQKNYYVVVLTTILDKRDLDKVLRYTSVHGILDKPITSEKISGIIYDIIPEFKNME
jgi:CheY-like chemotaxis protein